mmetsp:Transcript_12132/g.27461  ORF Transcript_12132/g.27461 Transcript_12132/m.27461 type:complete len:914 (-) Transcript_12132:39-2780(-)
MAMLQFFHEQSRRYDVVAPPAPRPPIAPKAPAKQSTHWPTQPASKPWHGSNVSLPSQSALLALLPNQKRTLSSHQTGVPRRRVVNANGASLEPLPKLKRDVLFLNEGAAGIFSPYPYPSSTQTGKGRSPTSFGRPTLVPLDHVASLPHLQPLETQDTQSPGEKRVGIDAILVNDISIDVQRVDSPVNDPAGEIPSSPSVSPKKSPSLTGSMSLPTLAMAKTRSSRLMKRESSGGRMQREPSLRTPRRVTIDEMQRQESPMDRRDTDEPTFIRKLSSKEEGKGGRTKAEVAWLNSRNAELVGVFRRLAQDGEAHVDSMKRALELLGFVSPDDGWIREVLDNMTSYTTLNFEEFLEFVVDYKAREEKAGAEFFAVVDDDHTGLINLKEMAELLSLCSLFPMRHVLEDIAIEVTGMEDVSADEIFSYDDFRRIFEVLKGREGFTAKDADTLKGVFRMFDADHSGDMDTRELMSALGYLGYALPRDVVVSVASEVDVDDSGTMNEMEFLKCIRKVIEREVSKLRQLFDTYDADGSEGISGSELHEMLRALGYYPTYRAIRDAAEDAGIGNLMEELNFEDLWRVCDAYRKRDGLARAEAQELEDIFNKIDTKKTGRLHTSEVARMFRMLGYPITFEVARKFADEVDVTGSGIINFEEFKKIIRKYRERDTRHATLVYNDHGGTAEAAMEALKTLGLMKFSKANLDFSDASHLAMYVQKSREKARDDLKAEAGFTEEQTQELQMKFNEHDEDGSGDIEYKELRMLLTDMFPHFASSAEKRPQLLEIIAEADEDRSGSLDFGDFVRLVRLWRDVEEKDKYAKEIAAIKDNRFGPAEIRDFRELFMGGVKERTRLTPDDLERMLSSTVPLGHRNLKDLKVMYLEEVFPKPHEKVDRLDFPEFLHFMRRLIDMNFAGMADFR